MLTRGLQWLAADRPALLAIASGIASLVVAPVSLVMVGRCLSAEMQGYYYTFGSLTVLQILAEFGLGQAVLQLVATKAPRVRIGAGGVLSGDAVALGHVGGLARFALRWTGFAAVVLAMALVLSGYALFGGRVDVEWKGPWALMAATMLGNLALAPCWAVLQGLQEVESYWFFRLVQQVLNGLALWVVLGLGGGLWTPGVAAVVGLVWSSGYWTVRYPKLLPSLFTGASLLRSRLAARVWQLQWKSAVTWTAANFTPQMSVPLLFWCAGPIQAGQFGMTATVGSVITAISSYLVITKGPRFGALAAKRNFAELDALFARAFRGAQLLAVSGAGAALGLLIILERFQVPLGRRLLPPATAATFLGATVVTACVASLGTYLRAFRREPLVGIYVLSSVVTLAGGTLWARQAGAAGMAGAALLTAVLIQLPLSVVMFVRSRRRWQRRGARRNLEDCTTSVAHGVTK